VAFFPPVAPERGGVPHSAMVTMRRALLRLAMSRVRVTYTMTYSPMHCIRECTSFCCCYFTW